jgi:alpha-L-fucosidase 2
MKHLFCLVILAAAVSSGYPHANGAAQALPQNRDQLKKHGLHVERLPRTWNERPIKEFARPEFSFSWVTGQFQKGDYKPVQDLFDLPYDRDPAPTKLPAGALEFPLPKGIPIASMDQGGCGAPG